MGFGGVEKKLFETLFFGVLGTIFGHAKPSIPLSDSHLSWKSKRCIYYWYRLAHNDCK
jgi:hypothetical protein